jgi:hypothetical protein
MKWLEIIKPDYKIFILIGLLVAAYFLDKSFKKSEKNLIENGSFTIGTFKKFTFSVGHGGGHHLEYFYYDEEGKYHSDSNVPIFPDKEQRKTIFEGDQFLVIYNDWGSTIFFECPIKDSTDFQRYVKEFEERRKKP